MGHPLPMHELANRARSHRMTPSERRAQRASLVMGLRGHQSTLTKDKVEGLLEEFEGSSD